MTTHRPAVAVALLAALSACAGAARPPRATRVDREERVTVTDPERDAFFARLHGVQTAFAAMDGDRARAQADLARALDLRADADRSSVSIALARRVGPQDGGVAIGFRARLNPERHVDALDGWEAALVDDARRARAFAALQARARVRVRGERCAELSLLLREAVALVRLGLAQSAVTLVLARVTEALAATAAEQARSGPPTLRPEYEAAARWLQSAPVRIELQRQAADQVVLWIRGVLSPDPEGEPSAAAPEGGAVVQETGCAVP